MNLLRQVSLWPRRMCSGSGEPIASDSAKGIPFVQQLYQKTAEVLDSKSEPPTLEDVQPLLHMMAQATLSDVGLRAPGEYDKSASPFVGSIKFMPIANHHKFSLVLIVMPPQTRIPLHDHPGMMVVSQLLHGRLRTLCLDAEHSRTPTPSTPVDAVNNGFGMPAEYVTTGSPRLRTLRAAVVHEETVESPQQLRLFPRAGGNIHSFEALSPVAIFDLMTPPYAAHESRDCQYFEQIGGAKLDGRSLLLTCPPADFYTEPWPYTGPRICL